MARTTKTVTGPVLLPNGAVPVNGKIIFTLSSWDKELNDAVYVPGPLSVPLDSFGGFSCDLFSNSVGENSTVYRVSVIHGTDRETVVETYIATVALSGTGTVKLSNLTMVPEWTPNSVDVLAQATAARDEAALSAISASADAASITNARTFTDITAALAAPIAGSVNAFVAGGRLYVKSASNPRNGLSVQHSNGNWYNGHKLPTKGVPFLIGAMGQSNMLSITGLEGGNRSCRDGVLIYENIVTGGNPCDQILGWSEAGPEDLWWPFRNTPSQIVTGCWAYEMAAEIHALTGHLCCVVKYAVGGQPIVEMMPGGNGGFGGATGTIWSGFQSAFSAALDEPLPGWGGKTLRQLGVTVCDIMCIDQGEEDCNESSNVASGSYNPRASTAAQYIANASTLIDAMAAPGGSSVPIIGNHTHIIWSQLLIGGTVGGAVGVGYATDDRNAEILSFPSKLATARRSQLSILSVDGLCAYTYSGDKVGTGDNLHYTGAGVNAKGQRAAKLALRGPIAGAAVQYTASAWDAIEQPGGIVTYMRDITLLAGVTTTYTFPKNFVTNKYGISIAHKQATSSTASADIHYSAEAVGSITLRNTSATLNAIFRLTVGPYKVT